MFQREKKGWKDGAVEGRGRLGQPKALAPSPTAASPPSHCQHYKKHTFPYSLHIESAL